jgi:hypothetical protein
MLDRAHKLRAVSHISLHPPLLSNDISQPVNLFISSADQLYGPITTLRREGRVIKHIPWMAFALDTLDWDRVLRAQEILSVSTLMNDYRAFYLID